MELVSEWWNCSLADDHHAYLRQKELYSLPTYYARSPQLMERIYLVDWLAVLCDATHMCCTTRHLGIALLDYFMDRHTLKPDAYLVALCMLRIAAKFEECEKDVPKLVELNRLGDVAFTSKQLLDTELHILEFFHWNISLPTAAHFFDYFFIISMAPTDLHSGYCLGDQATQAEETVSKYVHYFLEISLQDHVYRSYLPSQLCAACIAAARHCLHVSPTWASRLQQRTGYSWSDLAPVVAKLIRTHDRNQKKRKLSPDSSPNESQSIIAAADIPNVLNKCPRTPAFVCCLPPHCTPFPFLGIA